MRTLYMLKIAANAFALLIGLPIVIVAVLGIAFSPFQAVAHPADSQVEFVEVNDVAAPDAVTW